MNDVELEEIGDKIVQAEDFVYTINGWLKAVNGNVLNSSIELGKDGSETPYTNGNNLNRNLMILYKMVTI